MKFLYIKSSESLEDEMPFILEVLSKSLTISKYHSSLNSLVITYSYTAENIKEISETLAADMYKNITVYNSIEYLQESQLKKAIDTVNKLFDKNRFKEIYLDNKVLLEYFFPNVKEDVKKLVLDSFYQDFEMYKTIRVFLEENQSVVNASKKLYIHRNTLNQRLDKFYDKTNFNVKNFTDAYLIYPLIK